MKRKITVAAVQMSIQPKEIGVNLKKAQQMMQKIFAKEYCDLVVLPEYCITASDIVLDVTSEPVIFFKNLARKYKTYLVCGSFLKKIGKKYYNTSLLIDPKGNIILEYQKNNLWLSERENATFGDKITCVDTPIGKIGIIICWDLTFPETSRKLARQGVDIICCPSYWTKDDTGVLKRYIKDAENIITNTLCPARAIENEALFIYANGAGEAKFIKKGQQWIGEFTGQSQICAPILGTVARLDDNKEGFVTYKYTTQVAKDAEKTFKIREDLKTRLKS